MEGYFIIKRIEVMRLCKIRINLTVLASLLSLLVRQKE